MSRVYNQIWFAVVAVEFQMQISIIMETTFQDIIRTSIFVHSLRLQLMPVHAHLDVTSQLEFLWWDQLHDLKKSFDHVINLCPDSYPILVNQSHLV